MNFIARFAARWLGDDWSARSPLRFAVSRLREYRPAVIGIVGLSLLTAMLEGVSLALITLAVQVLVSQKVAEPFLVLGRAGQWALALLGDRSPLVVFIVLITCAVGAQILRSAAGYGLAAAGIFLQNRISRTSIALAYERVLALDFPTIIEQRGGEVSYKATAMPALAVVIQQLITAVQGLMMVIGYALLLLLIAPLFALFVVFGSVLLGYIMGFGQRMVRRHAERYALIQQDVSQMGVEMLQAFRLIHTQGTWAQTSRQIKDVVTRSYLSRRHYELIAALVGPVFEVILICSVAALLLGSVALHKDNSALALSSTLVSILIVYRAMPWANSLNHVRASLAQNLPSLGYAAALFNDPALSYRPLGLPALEEGVQSVSFDHVGYAYPGASSEAVKDISFQIPRGGCIALVGTSGSGKSTLIDLLIGLRAPSAGAVRVNGADLTGIDPASWRLRLGVVSQDTFLFNLSLRDNIAYGLAYDEERLKLAARLAHVDEFVRELPSGYDTVIGDRGFRLSGGQRQRLALARALYRKPEVLILDEATSALDSASERIVQKAIEEAVGAGITTLIVAHRLSTIAHADEILVLEHGRVVERGTHAALISRGEIYARLWSIQSLTETNVEAVETLDA
ncbi:MAG: ABC transporter ATP-binding protein [Pyrinomonadaceae bacterium]